MLGTIMQLSQCIRVQFTNGHKTKDGLKDHTVRKIAAFNHYNTTNLKNITCEEIRLEMFEINLSEKLVKYYCIIMLVQRYIREQD